MRSDSFHTLLTDVYAVNQFSCSCRQKKVYDLTSADQISAPRSAALLTRGPFGWSVFVLTVFVVICYKHISFLL